MEYKIPELKYTYNDVSIVPVACSKISSRSECNPLYGDGKLPLFTAPMSSVIGLDNIKLFEQNGIHTILPRTIGIKERIENMKFSFSAFSLSEFINIVDANLNTTDPLYICIDIANGHMKDLHDAILNAKLKFPNMVIMAGNVASPEGYEALSIVGCDYVRVGVGGGRACITSSNTGIHYPLASLVRECFVKKNNFSLEAKIVADGGIRGYSDITKALALGADYVMCGTVFNKMLESSSETKISNTMFMRYQKMHFTVNGKDIAPGDIVDQYDETIARIFREGKLDLEKIYYGMSTKKAQIEMGNAYIKTSEGIELIQKVEYTMTQWVENFKHYLTTAMSYVDKAELSLYVGLSDDRIIRMTQESINVINK
jgi:IMP dehydrogenase/GMP reductase